MVQSDRPAETSDSPSDQLKDLRKIIRPLRARFLIREQGQSHVAGLLRVRSELHTHVCTFVQVPPLCPVHTASLSCELGDTAEVQEHLHHQSVQVCCIHLPWIANDSYWTQKAGKRL